MSQTRIDAPIRALDDMRSELAILREAMERISLGSVNSMEGKEALGKIARDALLRARMGDMEAHMTTQELVDKLCPSNMPGGNDAATALIDAHVAELVETCVEGACDWYIFDNPSKPRDADLLRAAIRDAARTRK